MHKLIRLELKRHRMNVYAKASAAVTLGLIAFVYFIAYVAQVEKEADFQTYPNILLFTSIISMICFSVLASVMYSRIVIEEYSGNRLTLLFTYPVNRKKMLLAKVILVSSFSTIAMIGGNLLALFIFTMTESVAPIVNDKMSLNLVLSMILTIVILSISASVCSIAAMRIGFVRKSVPSAIVSALLLCALIGNLVIGSAQNQLLLFFLALIMIALGVFIVMELMNRIHTMETE
ncbi:ABC transporter permease [Paenibacillus amylolyticus]|uniref:ABC transporter permease n=1 Tax=Paenibacillus amylolyticus TaxID=1451 RepID=UPI00096C0196|nr:ABC transporter permease [Paenibacillus amylolyticus]OME90443.1 ABC transporter permease [Paenibacillus amylolyticus]